MTKVAPRCALVFMHISLIIESFVYIAFIDAVD